MFATLPHMVAGMVQVAELYEMSKGYKWICYECTKEVEILREKNKKWEEGLDENIKKNTENATCNNCASTIPIINIDETTPANSTPDTHILLDKPDVPIHDKMDTPTPMDTSQNKNNTKNADIYI